MERSGGDLRLGDGFDAADADEEFAGDGVALAESFGVVGAHVAAADGSRPGEHLVEIGREGSDAFDLDVGVGRDFLVDEQGYPGIAQEILAFDGALRRY